MEDSLVITIQQPEHLVVGDEVRFEAGGLAAPDWTFTWEAHGAQGQEGGTFTYPEGDKWRKVAFFRPSIHGIVIVDVLATRAGGKQKKQDRFHLTVQQGEQRRDPIPVRIVSEPPPQPIEVNLRRSAIVDTPDLPLWSVIRASTNKLSFNNYQRWMDRLFCRDREGVRELFAGLVRDSLPFNNMLSYKALKFATEAFLLTNTGVAVAAGDLSELEEFREPLARTLAAERFEHLSEEERDERLGLDRGDSAAKLWRRYLVPLDLDGDADDASFQRRPPETLPYLALVRRNLPELRVDLYADAHEKVELCDTIMGRKFTSPCFLELLWSYWHEEGMLVQTLNAIAMRFQNRSAGPRDPLAGLALDPLRPLNNLIWGYIQDEQHRLTLTRRVYEYDHEYGLTLFGRAVPRLRSADPRSRFLEAFHTLLHRTSIFYKEDDDTTMLADPFPVLNALRDVHLLLAEGADNAYGDLPWTARLEMLMQEWLLSRSELREFLPTRTAIAYPEEWMHRVDAMKRLQGWSDTSVRYFRDLGVFGEQIVLSIRYGNWSNVIDREQAGNWARYWRQEVQWYIHAYQSVTGVDLSADTADVRQAQLPPDRFTQPAFLLRDRLVEQRRRLPRFALRHDGAHHNGHRPPPPGAYHPGRQLQEAEEQPLR
jgi:hypothetical protein